MSNIIRILKQELCLESLILKTPYKSGHDIDIIISEKEFRALDFNDNLILIKDRYKCDKHRFYIYIYLGKIYSIDFNIDGLFLNGRIKFSIETIKQNLIYDESEGIYYLNNSIYKKYLEEKNKTFFSTIELKAFPSYIKHFVYKYEKVNWPKQKIVIMGIDGSGKSTIASGIASHFSPLKTHIVYMGWSRNFHNPFIRKYRALKYGNIAKTDSSMVVKNTIQKRSSLQLIIYYIELYQRYLTAVFNHKSHIVVFDRYFYDWLVLTKQKFVERMFLRLTPKSGLFFYLTAPDTVLIERKKDMSLYKIKKLKQIYADKDYIQNAKAIDTANKNENETVQIITEKIINKYKAMQYG